MHALAQTRICHFRTGTNEKSRASGWPARLLVNYGAISRPDGGATALAGPNPDAIFEREHENLAVADLTRVARTRGVNDRLDGRLHEAVIHCDFDLQLGQQA